MKLYHRKCLLYLCLSWVVVYLSTACQNTSGQQDHSEKTAIIKTDNNSIPLQEGTVFQLVSIKRGKELITSKDVYTERFSPFDIQAKTQNPESVLLDDYLNNAKNALRTWTAEEQEKVQNIATYISQKIKENGLHLNLPPVIELVKTTGLEEGGASGYTRESFIVLKENSLSERLLMHELFHVFSRYNPTIRTEIYSILGFSPTQEVKYPAEIEDLRITNPDAPFNNFYIDIEYDAKPIQAMIVLYANKPYEGGSFFQYINKHLLVVEKGKAGMQPVYKDDKPILLDFEEVTGLYEQIGKNTSYNIHPEEISAEHFVMLLKQQQDIPAPKLLERLKEILSKRA